MTAHKQPHTLLTLLVGLAAAAAPRGRGPAASSSTPERSPCAPPSSSSSSSPAAPRSSSSGSEPRGAGAWRGSGGGASCGGTASRRLAAGGGGGARGQPCAPAAVPPDCSGGGGGAPSVGARRPPAVRWGGEGAAARGARTRPLGLSLRDSFRRRASGSAHLPSLCPACPRQHMQEKANGRACQGAEWRRRRWRLRCALCLCAVQAEDGRSLHASASPVLFHSSIHAARETSGVGQSHSLGSRGTCPALNQRVRRLG